MNFEVSSKARGAGRDQFGKVEMARPVEIFVDARDQPAFQLNDQTTGPSHRLAGPITHRQQMLLHKSPGNWPPPHINKRPLGKIIHQRLPPGHSGCAILRQAVMARGLIRG